MCSRGNAAETASGKMSGYFVSPGEKVVPLKNIGKKRKKREFFKGRRETLNDSACVFLEHMSVIRKALFKGVVPATNQSEKEGHKELCQLLVTSTVSRDCGLLQRKKNCSSCCSEQKILEKRREVSSFILI